MAILQWLSNPMQCLPVVRFATFVNFDAVARRHLGGIPPPLCPQLSPYHLLRAVPAAPCATTDIWREARRVGLIPPGVLFGSFRDGLLSLSPVFISVTPGRSDTPETIVWQPWVPRKWRGQNSSSTHDVDQSDEVLFQVVPTYFVPATLVREQISAQCPESPRTVELQWHQLADSALAQLLDWSDDHVLVRLRNTVHDPLCGVANDLYGLKGSIETFHQALNMLALLLPTFTVSTGKVRWMYKAQFLTPGGAFHEEVGHVFRSRFPDAMALLDHPDLQFAMLRESSNDGLRLHPSFRHVHCGVADNLYTTLFHSPRTQPHSVSSQGKSLSKCIRLMLPYTRCAETTAALSYLSKESIVGLHCTFSNAEKRISLCIATTGGVVIACEGDSVSLLRLASSEVKDGGLPQEVADMLISPNVIKVLLTEPKGTEGCVMNERHMALLLRKYFNVEGKTICPLWKWALYVGFPISLPVPPDVSKYLFLSILTRGGAISDISLDEHPAWLTALCASRLLAFHTSEGHAHVPTALGQLLMASAKDDDSDDCEDWLRRNVHLRICRYGVKPKELATWKSCLHQLKTLSALYGPEVYIIRNELLLSESNTIEFAPSVDKEGPPTEICNMHEKPSVSDLINNEEYLVAVGDTQTPMPEVTYSQDFLSSTSDLPDAVAEEKALSHITSKDVEDENSILAALFGEGAPPEDADEKPEQSRLISHSASSAAVSATKARSESVSDSDKNKRDSTFVLKPPTIELKSSQSFRRKGRETLLPPPHTFVAHLGRPRGEKNVRLEEKVSRTEENLEDLTSDRVNQLTSEIYGMCSRPLTGAR